MLQLAWPSHLLFFHLERSAITLTNPVFAISLLFLIGVIVTAVILRRKRVHLPAFGITFFLVMLFPTFLAAQKAGILFFTSDKYAYLPSIGLLIAIAAGIRAIEAHWKALLLPLTILLVFCAAMLTVLTRELMPSWTSAESLERAVLAKDESNYIARSNLGLLIQKETPDDALAQFMAAIESEPHYAIPYFNAASVLRSQGKQDEAVALFATMIPQLTEREVRGDRSLQTALVWLAQKFGEWGKPDLSEQLIEKLQQMVPHLFELR
jgi:tetratricopeptide (TPR) repeat protein